jgi:hypothetical protein
MSKFAQLAWTYATFVGEYYVDMGARLAEASHFIGANSLESVANAFPAHGRDAQRKPSVLRFVRRFMF